MRTIGLIGGMSWESTQTYYQIINQQVNQRLGGLHSAKLVLISLDFAQIEQLQKLGDWKTMAELLSKAALDLQHAGAECVLICTNTMHRVAEQVQSSCNIPLLHIADATAAKMQQLGISKAGLLGTRFTMEQDFYTKRIAEKFGIETLIPEAFERQMVHDVIYNELCKGKIAKDSKQRYLSIIDALQAQGAQGVILGCTEIPLLIEQSETSVPLLNTTLLHACAAVDFALADNV